MSKEINKKNVLNYLEGRTNQLLSKLNIKSESFEEQVEYRKSKCRDCIKDGQCPYCGCPVPDRFYTTSSCNNGIRFPDIMSDEEWLDFKNKLNE